MPCHSFFDHVEFEHKTVRFGDRDTIRVDFSERLEAKTGWLDNRLIGQTFHRGRHA